MSAFVNDKLYISKRILLIADARERSKLILKEICSIDYTVNRVSRVEAVYEWLCDNYSLLDFGAEHRAVIKKFVDKFAHVYDSDADATHRNAFICIAKLENDY